MHDSVMRWVERTLDSSVVQGRDVAEAGALDVNGTVRPWVESLGPASYTGYDLQLGAGVDVVAGAAEIPGDSADLVISTEMLEHARNWQDAIWGMTRALRAGGLLLLTTRAPGFGRHDYPGDYWRFTCPLLARVLVDGADMDLEQLLPDPDWSGVFALARRPVMWRPRGISGYGAIPVEGDGWSQRS